MKKMTTSNHRLHYPLIWEEYLKIPAHSFSSLMQRNIPPTAGMSFGTAVHNYLLEPGKYTGERLKEVKACAAVLKNTLGGLQYLPEAAVTATFHHDNRAMAVRGKVDILVPDTLVVDLKVSKMDVVKAIQFFRYDWQLSGYGHMSGVKELLLISLNPVTLKPSIIKIPRTSQWWERQILINGTQNAA